MQDVAPVDPNASRDAGARPARLAAAACVALAVGAAVYLADRDPARVALLPKLVPAIRAGAFGPLGQWLPSFVHPFAFGLLTAAVLRPAASPRYGACAAWCAVNVVAEIGQHPFARPAWAALEGAHGGPITRAVVAYFVHGTFDPGDLVAAVLGALAAAAVLRFAHSPTEARHAR